MIIKYFGHSCFKITDGDRTIVFDPFGNIGYKQEDVAADYCVCSHSHYDHNALDFVKAKNFVENDNLPSFLKAVRTFHDECGGVKRGVNDVLIYGGKDGTVFCHMGDVGERCSDEIVAKIGKIDLLAIPVGGNYTIDAERAAEYVKRLSPSVVIPMHYKTRHSNIDISEKGEFLGLFESEKIVKAQREFTVLKETLSGGLTIVDFFDGDF